jgi:uncharacterized protein (DUF302 family)
MQSGTLLRAAAILSLVLITGSAARAAGSSAGGDVALVDELVDRVAASTVEFQPVVAIDHARLAAEAGVDSMPPSRVVIFNNPAVTTRLLQVNPHVGLDLPYRVLAYSDKGTVRLAFADESFIRARYGLDEAEPLADYQRDILHSVRGIDHARLSPVEGRSVTPGYGIISLESSFDFLTTISRLRDAIISQGDTVWFGEVDYRADADKLGVILPPSTLLLFGGPAPGGLAMTEYPRLGLDAFCQKVLVVEDGQGRVSIHFNDIVALAELHYGSSNQPQAVINQRLVSTLGRAVAGAE